MTKAHIKLNEKVHLIYGSKGQVLPKGPNFLFSGAKDKFGTEIQTVSAMGSKLYDGSHVDLVSDSYTHWTAKRFLPLNSVIHCRTEEGWKDLMEKLEEIGYSFSSKKPTTVSYIPTVSNLLILGSGTLCREGVSVSKAHRDQTIPYGYLFGDEPLESNIATEEPVEPQTETITNEPMANLTQTQKDQLPEAMQAQILADLRNTDLSLTAAGQQALQDIIANKFEKQLTASAEAILEEREKNSA